MANFIDFILRAQTDPALVAKFLTTDDPTDLQNLFNDEGITLDPGDIPKLIKAKKNLQALGAIRPMGY